MEDALNKILLLNYLFILFLNITSFVVFLEQNSYCTFFIKFYGGFFLSKYEAFIAIRIRIARNLRK